MNRARSQRGFTLVELLVVIAIIGVLVSLLLPAVQAAREAARRMQCSNNLKQLTLALHNYADVHRSFPPAYIRVYYTPGVATDQDNDQRGNWSWSAMLLPFMEQQALHQSLQVGPVPLAQILDVPANRLLVQTPLPAFRCPSDTGPNLNVDRRLQSHARTPVETATSNYLASNGTGNTDGDASGIRRGAFIRDNGVRFAEILDGTSNTFAFGERAWRRKQANGTIGLPTAGLVFGCRGQTTGVMRDWGIMDVVAAGRFKLNYDQGIVIRFKRCFCSNHPGGAMFSMCDGSVRFVSDTVDADMQPTQQTAGADPNSIWENLIAIQDGNSIGDF